MKIERIFNLRVVILPSEKLKFYILHQTKQLVGLVASMNTIPYAVQKKKSTVSA